MISGLKEYWQPPPIAPLERQIILTRLILQWSQSMETVGNPVLTPASPADAAYLAGALARLLDMMTNEGVSFDALHSLGDGSLHWRILLFVT